MILIDIGEGRKTKETNWDLSYVCATRHIKVGLGFLAVKKGVAVCASANIATQYLQEHHLFHYRLDFLSFPLHPTSNVNCLQVKTFNEFTRQIY